jgi:hypothetical protein
MTAAAETRQAQHLAWRAALFAGAVLCMLLGVAVGLAVELSPALTAAAVTAER